MYQRQKFYCHMCRKQCRDENGFKCHKTSESHKRNMNLFVEDPDSYVEQFSQEFEEEFMKVFEARFPTQSVAAGKVYGLTIGAKRQIHLNSTKWESLRDFLGVRVTQYLEEKGEVEVEDSEAGPMIRLKRQAKVQKLPVAENEDRPDDDAAMISRVMKIAAEVAYKAKPAEKEEFAPLASNSAPIMIQVAEKPTPKPLSKAIYDLEVGQETATQEEKVSALDYISQDSHNRKRNRDGVNPNNRFLPGIVVRVIDKTSSFYNQKGRVTQATSSGAVIEMRTEGVVEFSSHQLQNVIPNIGGEVAIVSGKYRGMRGKVAEVRVKEGLVDVSMPGGVLRNLPLSDVCKNGKNS